MEYIEKILKKTGWSSLISSIIFSILGIVLMMKPEGTVKFVSYLFGIMFVLIGVYKIIDYIKMKGKYNLYNYDMAYGIIAILLGVITIAYSHQIGAIFRILIGIWISYRAIIRITLALKMKSMNVSSWMYSLVIALLMLVCGIYVICNSGVIIVTIGMVILIYSILDVIESVLFLKNVKNMEE